MRAIPPIALPLLPSLFIRTCYRNDNMFMLLKFSLLISDIVKFCYDCDFVCSIAEDIIVTYMRKSNEPKQLVI